MSFAWQSAADRACGGFAFLQPEDASPLVADLFAWWNARRGIQGRRLLVSSFILLDPTVTLQSGAIPSWMVFNTRRSVDALERFLAVRPGQSST